MAAPRGPWSAEIDQATFPDQPAVLDFQVTELSADDLAHLLASPKTVLQAHGSGFAVQPVMAVLQYDPITTDYTLGDASQFFIGPAGDPLHNNVLQAAGATLVDGSGGPGAQIAIMPLANVIQVPQSAVDNVALTLTHNGTGELTGGDGTIKVTIYFIKASTAI